MTDRATLFEGVQIGLETTPGTSVAASKKLLATSFEIGPKPDVSIFRPNGYKFPTIASLNREWVEGKITGQMCYTDLAYLLSGLITQVTPTTSGTTGKLWSFASTSDDADDPATFTIEQGSSVRAHKFTFGMVTGLTLSFSNDGCKVDGSIMGQALSDGITLTSTPTEIALQPVMRTEVVLKLADSAAGLAAASAIDRGFSVDWSMTDRFGSVWALNGSSDFEAFVETEPKTEVTLMMEADATGMGLLTQMRAGSSKFLRIEATGPQIGAGPATYKLTLDSCLKITDADTFSDNDGVVAMKWTAQMAHDSTWTKSFNIDLINALASL